MKKRNIDAGRSSQLYLCFLATVLALLIPDVVFASSVGSDVGAGLCLLAGAFTGEIAAGVGTIAICTIGCLACVGRVQWTTAILCGTGIAVMFGAAALITQASGSAHNCGYSWT